jgi:fermentation-respiration switch protein FrsA (DUF1100 family)
MREFYGGVAIGMISPTPYMIVAGDNDELLPLETLKKMFERAGEPKKLVSLPVSHFDIYREPWISQACQYALEWFQLYL